MDKFIKICFFGNSAVGKSSLIRRMSEDTYADFTVPTIGFALKIVDFEKHGLYLRYQMWDSAGQEKYKSISPAHYKSTYL